MPEPFVREERYYVIKQKRLDADEHQAIQELFDHAFVAAVVVEHDWPEYERVWQMIEARMSGVKLSTVDTAPDDLAHAPEVPHHRFSTFYENGDYAYARGLEVNPIHLPVALDAMRLSGWHLVSLFGQTDSQHIGFIFKREPATDDKLLNQMLAERQENDRLRARVDELFQVSENNIERRRDAERRYKALAAHVRQMQDCASRYLQPEPYIDREGCISHKNLATGKPVSFISDIIYLLDGPEQREVLPNEEPPHGIS